MTLHESSLRIILRDNFKGGFFMSEKMLVTQALDERDLLVKKISDKIDKARELSEEGKQQYLEERIRKFEIDAMQQVSFLDGINFREDENTFLEDLSREMYLVI